jgi:hypothetical protein
MDDGMLVTIRAMQREQSAADGVTSGPLGVRLAALLVNRTLEVVGGVPAYGPRPMASTLRLIAEQLLDASGALEALVAELDPATVCEDELAIAWAREVIANAGA